MKAINLIEELATVNQYQWYGNVTRVVGLTIEARGPRAAVGEICEINQNDGSVVLAEVVGFKETNLLLMPLSKTNRIQTGSLVKNRRKPLEVAVGNDLIGKVVDGLGQPLNGERLPRGLKKVAVEQPSPNPLTRPRITETMPLGIKVIDGLLTVGVGQRVGIFAGSGVGKSTLLSMITKSSAADVNVIALIGERGREVRDFIEKELGEEGMKRSIVVAATSDQPALVRIKGAQTATAIAEYFRDQGKHVNLMMDSVTRFAMAQREVGLAAGEPPTTKGYTPSVFAMLPQLLERSGTSVNGAITAFYTVLVDGDDLNEPITDAVRGILDGHFILDRSIANRGHYPAIDVLKSVSRLMNDITEKDHQQAAQTIRERMSAYRDTEDLISVGAYKKGHARSIDLAVELQPEIQRFLQQSTGEHVSLDQTRAWMNDIAIKE
ncbi:LOW QUALITY PROTEIN: flagellum-specific ATP synthase FliI [Geomicrobium sp. JCM 19037]|uniref:flagellar protein export ATPase FliI n=1 Tax=Geomicrobium sp. JSM 1781026 TaxID=3344580 RepID=UPI00045F3904|nr:LOW QUALITY PROTEIN: flagellum-specific ATP synthase FliI [Geomicrobium sp. JCM 19037]